MKKVLGRTAAPAEPSLVRMGLRPRVAVAVGALALLGLTVVGLTGGSAVAAGKLNVPDPYPVPQSAPGVPNRAAVDITVSGLTPGTFENAQLCDGVSPTSAKWAPNTDCGPAEAAFRVPASGVAQFSGTNPNFAIILWHGSNGGDKVYGEMPFNCLAPNDNPQSSVTAQGNQPIDSTLPAWGSSMGGTSANPTGSNGSVPCQIRFTSSLPSYSPGDIFEPINLAATHASLATGATATAKGAGATGHGSGATGAVSTGGSRGSASGATAGSSGQGGASSTANGTAAGDPPHDSSSGGLFGGSLAQTGAEIAGMVIVALALVFGGLMLVRLSRRRAQQA